ncbi:MAG: hypothetical protein QGI86_27495, partial [Candidatus Poribacteria bacterium]|nr:hypothetical protein [Candidatus Poribacteria bacterium]
KTVEQAAMLTSSTLIDSDDISFRRTLTGEGLSSLPDPVGDFVLPEFVSSVRREMIERAVKLEGGRIEGGRMIGCNQKAVADRLGIKPQAINQELKKTM